MATLFCALRTLAPLAVGLALCTGPRAVIAQVIVPEYERLLDEVNVSGALFLGIMTGDRETEVRPDGSVMHLYVWIPEELLAAEGVLCVRLQSIDGLYVTALRVTSEYLRNVPDQEKPGWAYHLAYRTQVNDRFGVRHANEVAIHAFWSANCGAAGESDPRLVAAWERESADPNAIWLLLNNPEGRALLGDQRCRSLDAIDRSLVSYDKLCEARLQSAPSVTLEVRRWDGIEFQATDTIVLERPVAVPALRARPPDSRP